MIFTKVVTHDTTFHADDVFAVALLRVAGCKFNVVRTRDKGTLTAAIDNPSTLVLDVGGIYDPEWLNFDHHQDVNLPSAASLIYNHFKKWICMADAQPYFSEFIDSIDAIDTNRDNVYELWRALPTGFRHTSAIIGGFNRDVTNRDSQNHQFEYAVQFAESIIRNELYTATRKAQSERDYADRLILDNNVAVFDEYNTIWKEKKDHVFVVLPHAQGWQIQTIDTTIRQIPESISECEGFIFRHGSGFMAVVEDRQVAINFASTLEPMYRNLGYGD